LKDRFQKIVVVGGSRGVGAAVAEHIMPRTTELITVSRSPSSFGKWIKADISTKTGIETVVDAVGNSPLDALSYMGGTWETNAFTAFTSEYSFEKCSDEDIEKVITVCRVRKTNYG
jgi:3-oxoacyl-[acyl-carrier protein] reductase